eukprot:snap_masked-scaffold_45-processed-gene-1.77-mRNA-1 protein AED:1.00 eAED:1.00 QI:0/0/0/0/1/1/3/0/148
MSQELKTCNESSIQSGDKPCCVSCCEKLAEFFSCRAGCDLNCIDARDEDVCEEYGFGIINGVPLFGEDGNTDIKYCCLFLEGNESQAFLVDVDAEKESCSHLITPSPTLLPTLTPTEEENTKETTEYINIIISCRKKNNRIDIEKETK